MRRKSVLLTVGVLAFLVGGALTGLALVVRHEPRFYRDRAVAPGPHREQESKAFQQEFVQLMAAIKTAPRWQAAFTETQINSFLQEDFIKPGAADKLLPDNISEPRVALEPDTIRLAFRYEQGPWSTIISINLRVWLAPKEVNVVALELEGLQAGALPISAQSLLEQISEIARRRNIEVTWYRHGGNPVALLRFQGDRPSPTVQLRHLKVSEGRLALEIESLDRTPRVTALPPAALAPAAN
jgi:hypothetical protein